MKLDEFLQACYFISRLRGCFVPLPSAVFFSLRTLLWDCCHFFSRLTDYYKPKIWTCSLRWDLWTVLDWQYEDTAHRLCWWTTAVQAREAAQLTRTSVDLQLKKQLVSHKVTEFKRLFYSVIDAVQGEMDACFGEHSSKLIGTLAALNPKAEDNFLDPSKVIPLLVLAGTDVVESEYTVAHEFLVKKMTDTLVPPADGKWTIANILSTFNCAIQAMLAVVTAYTVALTLAMCEN